MCARRWIVGKHHGPGKPPGDLDAEGSNRLSWNPLPGAHLQLLAVTTLKIAPLRKPVLGRHSWRRLPEILVLDQHNIQRDGAVLVGICINADVEIHRAGLQGYAIGNYLGLVLDAGTGGAAGTNHQ